MKVIVDVDDQLFSIEVLPSDTVWTLKCRIYENMDFRKHYYDTKGIHPVGPDDQQLWMPSGGRLLDDCERSLESYSCRDGSSLLLEIRELSDGLSIFRRLLSVYRKGNNRQKGDEEEEKEEEEEEDDDENEEESHSPLTLNITPISWVKHGSVHIHEVRSIRFISEEVDVRHLMSWMHYVIHSMTSLKELDLSWNELIGQKGYIQITKELKGNTSLKAIYLSGCQIGLEGATQIGKMLNKNCHLTTLDLFGNYDIGNEGTIRIAEGLETNTSLKTLNMSWCGIGSKGVIGIGKMLMKNSSLITLIIRENDGIEDVGWIQITEALEVNTTLKTLDYTFDERLMPPNVHDRMDCLLLRNCTRQGQEKTIQMKQ
eukprot:TRINITY_DN1109_c0_g2_i1.p1 TRINITY_DN1109_c0_g2~~TRINITY_DN1109_c0_g2_i1.p1  ORF type:complete len:371 (-),score=103.48 TRINITY_DN1109_c0_g2_i1:175-1287(-)